MLAKSPIPKIALAPFPMMITVTKAGIELLSEFLGIHPRI
jgi:hypothetical protein